MTWLYGAVGLALGLAIGWVMHAHVARAIEAENQELRGALRNIRLHVADHWQVQALTIYIDRLLGDEAG